MKPLVFACDHAVARLVKAGLIPDAVFAVDGSGFVWSDLYDGVPLIASLNTSPSLTYSWNGPVYFYGMTDPIMQQYTAVGLPIVDLLIGNCRTVGATLATLAMWQFKPKRLHSFGMDYCWVEPDKQHAMKFTFADMEKQGVRVMTGWKGGTVRTYDGFWVDAMLFHYRMAEWQANTGGEVIWYGESIVPLPFGKVDQGVVSERSDELVKGTVARMSNLWRGAARANAMHPDRGDLRKFMDSLMAKGAEDVAIVGAGPSLDETVSVLSSLMNGAPAEPVLAAAAS